MMLRLALLLLALALPASAEEVVAGLSQNRVAITSNFAGSEILIFGAVKRQTPPPDTEDLEVIITVSGPSTPVTVRRKEKRALIWVNTEAVDVDAAPSFYAVATTAPLAGSLRETEDLRHQITIPRAIRSVGAPMTIQDSESFTDALIRIRTRNNLYQVLEDTVHLEEDTLFNTAIALPANLTEGNYRTRIFLTRDGRVIDKFETTIFVQKVGLERFVFLLSREQPLVYGLLSLLLAILAGWGASEVFRYLRS